MHYGQRCGCVLINALTIPRETQIAMARNMNPHLPSLTSDYLYHLGYSREQAKGLFGDVKFVIMGGSGKRMGSFAEVIAQKLGHPKTEKHHFDITQTDRYSFYKIGPVISISHGMGVPSITILLHEIIKLLHYAEAVDPIIIRIGTCGGLGVPAGTLVVSDRTYNGFLKEEHNMIILGKQASRPAVLNKELAESILKIQKDGKSFETILGSTLCTDDFYEGQARLDGAICEYTEHDRKEYLHQLKEKGIVNIEMEATAISSLCYKANVKCAIVCVTLVDRLNGDQVDIEPETYTDYSLRPQNLVSEYIYQSLRGN